MATPRALSRRTDRFDGRARYSHHHRLGFATDPAGTGKRAYSRQPALTRLRRSLGHLRKQRLQVRYYAERRPCPDAPGWGPCTCAGSRHAVVAGAREGSQNYSHTDSHAETAPRRCHPTRRMCAAQSMPATAATRSPTTIAHLPAILNTPIRGMVRGAVDATVRGSPLDWNRCGQIPRK